MKTKIIRMRDLIAATDVGSDMVSYLREYVAKSDLDRVYLGKSAMEMVWCFRMRSEYDNRLSDMEIERADGGICLLTLLTDEIRMLMND